MRNFAPLVLALAFNGTAAADSVTPTEHPERGYRAIGGGLYLQRDDELTVDDDGNITVSVFSRSPINAGPHYSVDLSRLAGTMEGIPLDAMVVDAGSLGLLHVQMITIDCTHRTFEVFDVRKLIPQFIWRPASALPPLAPVFQYICSHLSKTEPRP